MNACFHVLNPRLSQDVMIVDWNPLMVIVNVICYVYANENV